MEQHLDRKNLTEGVVWKKLLIFFLPIAAGTCIQQLYNAVDGLILEDYHPFRIFVCADLQARLARCMGHEANRPQEERLTEKQILRNIRRIDWNRANTREILTGKASGDGSAFELTVNTTGWDIKKLTEALGDFAEKWFEEQ